jgi:PAS domain-containing protein
MYRRELLAGQRERKIRRLVDANIIGIQVWDREGRIIEANDAFLHIVGYDRDVLREDVRWTELTSREWCDADDRALAEINATGAASARWSRGRACATAGRKAAQGSDGSPDWKALYCSFVFARPGTG